MSANKMRKNNWTREELILAFNLYLKTAFGKMHSKNPDIIQLASLIGRTPNSVAIRLTNFAHIDPYHQSRGIKGMSGGKKQVEPIWNEFIHDKERLVFESEMLLAQKENSTLEKKYSNILSETKNLKGEFKIREVKTRINQSFFRQLVLANYSNTCAITGINISELLVASHILPWAKHETERLNPENGICLSPTYDKAFDIGLITINERYEVQLSNRLKQLDTKEYFTKHFGSIEKKKINPPTKYLPRKEFLQFHMDTIFLR